jgi:hypothetical protein
VSRHMPTVLLCSSCARLRTTSVRCAAFPECGRAAWRRLLSVALSSAHRLFGSTHLFRIREGNRWELGVGLDLPSQYSHNNRHNNSRNNRQLPVTVGSKVVR